MCPNKMAVQMSAGRSPRVAWNRAQSPSGTTICDTIEMYSGDRVSPVPWRPPVYVRATVTNRSEEHTSELQSRLHLVCRLLLEKKKKHHDLVATLEKAVHHPGSDAPEAYHP